MWGPEFRVQSSEFRVQSSEFRVQSSESRVQSSEFTFEGRAWFYYETLDRSVARITYIQFKGNIFRVKG